MATNNSVTNKASHAKQLQIANSTYNMITFQDIQSLIDRLIFDGEVVRYGDGYRSITNPSHSNAWVEAPCGQCPVFGFCHKDGPVGPDSCIYMADWLQEI